MRTVKLVVLLVGIGAIAASLAMAAETTSKPAATKAAASKTAKTAKPAAATKGARSATSAPAAKTATKTLEDITIEGEVRLPEVLFITSRDVERPLDWLAGYLNAETGAAAQVDDAPVHVHVVPVSPSDSAAAVGAQVGAEILFLPAPESTP